MSRVQRIANWFRTEKPWLQWRWRIVFAILLVLTLDVNQPPSSQVSAKAYISAVRMYQVGISPTLSVMTTCRYHPSCSHYSIGCVEKYGIVTGGWMSIKRIASCTPLVPMGTEDPVP